MQCLVFGHTIDVPVRVCVLIDSGAHIVLICPELASELQLERIPLPEPESISLTLNKSTAPETITLHEYVIVSVFSYDQDWFSVSLHALVASGLCAPLILGLPFLESNALLADFEHQTLVDKRTNINILAAIPRPHKQKFVPLSKQIQQLRAERKALLVELKVVCVLCHEQNEVISDGNHNIVGTVKWRIDELLLLEKLEKHEKDLKSAFSAIFEPIPHIDELPHMPIVEIRLKDASKVIETHTYQCP